MVDSLLFDFDGVIADTEKIYDAFWNAKGREFSLGYENFAALLKGRTLKNILAQYFGKFDEAVIEERVIKDLRRMEANMDFAPIKGSVEFLKSLKGYKKALVTSSSANKMKNALAKLGLTGVFDAEITSDFVSEGKPNPQCYLIAAEKLGALPENCVVFEDSESGMQAALNAKMHLIGLSTTLSEAIVLKYTKNIFADFSQPKAVLECVKSL